MLFTVEKMNRAGYKWFIKSLYRTDMNLIVIQVILGPKFKKILNLSTLRKFCSIHTNVASTILFFPQLFTSYIKDVKR